MGNSSDWQAEAADFFENSRGSWILFNPRQGSWDPNKKGEMDYQVNWELEHLEKADFILMNFLPDSKSPITLLELGLFAKSGKLDVVCTEGFYRYDNVRITCAKYGVPVYASLTEAIRGIISSSSMRGMSSLHSRTVNALQLIKIIPSMSADSLSLGRDPVALDGLLDGLVVRPWGKPLLLDVGNRCVPLLGKGGGEEPGYHHFYVIFFAPC